MSDMTNKSIEYLLQELNNWVGSEVTIEKHERNDIDYHTLTLEGVEIVRQLEDEDDYVDPYTIELQGPGTVSQPDSRNNELLPFESYELPIRELVSVEASTELLKVKTDRATYTFKK